MATKRLIKELEAYNRNPSHAIASLEPVSEDDLFHLRAVLRGPAETAYEGGLFHLTLTIPPTYPSTPPTIHFQTPCCHSNINFRTGEICLDLLKEGAAGSWTPAYGLVSTLEAVYQLLSAGGEPDNPFNLDVARLLREGDFVGAEGLVRFYTGLYAVPR